jgi:hypothetical protein
MIEIENKPTQYEQVTNIQCSPKNTGEHPISGDAFQKLMVDLELECQESFSQDGPKLVV